VGTSGTDSGEVWEEGSCLIPHTAVGGGWKCSVGSEKLSLWPRAVDGQGRDKSWTSQVQTSYTVR